MANTLDKGMIVALLHAKAKAKTREEWGKALDKFWADDLALLKKQRGFVGAKALWAIDDSGEVVVMGIWDNLEDRLAYEKTVAEHVRANIETTIEKRPARPKYVVVRSD
ncbi:MAG: antibiotic biosynthesis monooxygenase [Chloroflexota bacterium]